MRERNALLILLVLTGLVIAIPADAATNFWNAENTNLSIAGKLFVDVTNSKIGIGTTSPSTLLQIHGGTPISASDGLQFGTDTSANLYRSAASTIKTDATLSAASKIQIESSTGVLAFYTGTVNFTRDIAGRLDLNLQNDFAILPGSGNGVGIGTTSPTSKLTVSGNFSTTTGAFLATSSGDVGIGTTSPTQKLHVSGNANVTGNVTATYFLGDGSLLTGVATSSPWDNTSTQIFVRSGYPTFINASNALFVNGTSGNVGIGTASPSEKLNVNGSLRVDNSTGSAVLFANATAGKVGIGTTTAGSKLHVASENTIDAPQGDIIMSRHWVNSTETRASAIFHYFSSGAGVTKDFMAFGVSGQWNDVEQSYLTPNQISLVKMVIGANGNVGIGTTSPSEKLSVSGNLSANSIYDTGTRVISTVTAGTGLTGGGSGPSAALDVGAGTGIIANANDVALNTTYLSANYIDEAQASSISSAMITDGAVANADLANSSLTVTAGTGLTSGGSVSLGGTTTLNANTTYFDANYVNENQANSITTGMITDGQVQTADIADNNVTNTKLASDTASLNKVSGGELTAATGLVTVNNDLRVNKNLYLLGNLTNVNVATININGSLNPFFTGTFNLGNSTNLWNYLYISGGINTGTDISAAELNVLDGGITASEVSSLASSHTHSADNITSGTLPIARGGTNSNSALTNNKIMVASGGAIVEGPAGTTTTVLHGNAAGLPTYSAVALGSDVSGTLPLANGGTGGDLSSSSNLPLKKSGTNVTAAAIGLASSDVTGTLAASNGGTGIAGAGGTANRVLRTSDGSTWTVGQVANADIANSSLTVTAGTGLTGGGSVSLGGTTTLNVNSSIADGSQYDSNFINEGQAAGGDLTGTYPSPTITANAVALTTDTTGDYVANLTQGTGISITSGTGEGSQPTIAVNSTIADGSQYDSRFVNEAQANSITTGMITDGTVANADLANSSLTITAGTGLTTGGSVALGGSVTLNVNSSIVDGSQYDSRFINSGEAAGGDLTGTYPNPTIAADAVELGTDTTGDYVKNVSSGSGITVTGGSGESSTPSVALATSIPSDRTFTDSVTVNKNVVVGGNFTVLGDYVNATVENQYLNGTFQPGLDALFDIGTTAARWRTGYFSDNVTVGSSIILKSDGTISTTTGDITLSPAAGLSTAAGKNITFDSTTLFVDATNDKVGVGTTSPNEKLSVSGNFSTTTGALLATSSGNVSIGTTASSNKLLVSGSTDSTLFNITDGTRQFGVYLGALSGGGTGASLGTMTEHQFRLFTNNTDRLIIDTLGNASLAGNFTPGANNTYSLGSPTLLWKDVYVGPGSLFLGGTALTNDNGTLKFGGTAVGTGGNGTAEVWKVVDTQTVTSLSSVNFTGLEAGNKYRVVLEARDNSASSFFYLRFNSDSGSNYYTSVQFHASDAANSFSSGTAQSQCHWTRSSALVAGGGFNYGIYEFTIPSSDNTFVVGFGRFVHGRTAGGAYEEVSDAGCRYDGSASVANVSLIVDGGTMNATAKLLKLANITGGSGSGHTIANLTNGSLSSLTSRTNLAFDTRYFTLTDNSTLDATTVAGYGTLTQDVWGVVETKTVTTGTSAEFTGLEPGKFYKIELRYTQTGAQGTNADTGIEFNSDTGTNYKWGIRGTVVAGVSGDTTSDSDDSIPICTIGSALTVGSECKAIYDFATDYNDSTKIYVNLAEAVEDLTDTRRSSRNGMGWYDGASALSSVRIRAKSGNFSADVRLLKLGPVTAGAAISVPASDTVTVANISTTATTLGTCYANATILTTGSSDVMISFNGEGYNSNGAQNCEVGVMRDGSFIGGQSTTKGVTKATSTTATHSNDFSFVYHDLNVSAGSHTYCFTARVDGSGTCDFSGEDMQFRAQEIRNVAGTGDVASNGNNVYTGTNNFTSTTVLTKTRMNCPSGFTEVTSQSRTLGCIETAEEGSDTVSAAIDDCFDTYGGRLPFKMEWFAAALNFALTDETDDYEWMADGDIVKDVTSNANVKCGSGSITTCGYDDVGASNAYRCWIPK